MSNYGRLGSAKNEFNDIYNKMSVHVLAICCCTS